MGLVRLIGYPFRSLQAYLLKRKLSNSGGQVHVGSLFLNVKIKKEKNAKLVVKGTVDFTGYQKQNALVLITLEENSTLQIDGDIAIFSGSQIYVRKNGFLKIGGRRLEPNCCIISSSIGVYKRIEIGTDCVISSGVEITDSNWHYVEYDGVPVEAQSDVIIGDHVWICPESAILKGTIIGNGSIVGRRSLLSGKVYPSNSLIAGMPAKAIKNNCKWRFDLLQPDSNDEPEINKADSL